MTNHSDVRLIRIQLVDIRDHGTPGDDVEIVSWNPQEAIREENIAWIEAHTSATNAAPRMPQLELRMGQLPVGLTMQAKLEVQYTRGNGARAGRNQAEDRVRIPADGSFLTVEGEVWRIWESYANEPFFGGEATLTYRVMKEDDPVGGSREVRFRIGGRNPDDDRCRGYIESRPNAGPEGNLWFAYAIARSESRDYNGEGSRYNQFLELPTHPQDVGRPLWGNDPDGPGGYGMFQVTGIASNNNANIAREQLWNWMKNVDGAMPILAAKRVIADTWMNNPAIRPGTNIPDGQRPQARQDRGVDVPVPDRTVSGVLFSDDPNASRDGIIEDAVAVKAYNGAATHYCSWGGNTAGWTFNNTNNFGFDYVDRVCQEVENDEE